MRLSVVIPNFNGERLLEQLLPQLLRVLSLSGIESEIIVADDASTDGSVALVREGFPDVRLAEGKENLGFGGNCNRGALIAQGGYIAFLNSDIALGADPFSPLLAQLDSDALVFAAMPVIYATALKRVENVQEIWQSRGLPWLRPVPGIPVESEGSVLAALAGRALEAPLCGAFFICRRSFFNELGGFSPVFGKAYWEDIDLGFAAKQRGWKTLVCPSAVAQHMHSQTMDRVLGDIGKRKRLLRNQALFLRRNLDLLKPVHCYRWYLLLRIPQRMFSGEWGTIAPYLSLIFGSPK